MAKYLADLFEDRALDVLALRRRLDHQARRRHRFEVRDRLDPAERYIALLRVHLFLGDQPVELAGDAVLALLRMGQIHVGQEHMIARLRADLRDAGTHLSSANDPNRLHRYPLFDKQLGFP